MLLQAAFGGSVAWAVHRLTNGPRADDAIRAAQNVPLFLFALLGGGLLRRLLTAAGLARWIDTNGVGRLTGVAMEFLIVAGLATLRLDAIGRFGGPVLLLVAAAAAWSVFCLLVLSPRLLPKAYWFELGLLNFGFSTCNTPQGLMLVRIIDPKLRSGAAADYAVAAPLSAPFIGGGVVTFLLLPPLLTHANGFAVLGGLVLLMTGLYALGRRLGREG